ncbi:UDP-4-amino-4,6-dideoxy-N-acetyl-beta-L-altrosamine transaminase [Pseudoalteromonas sp. TB64]|uniref:UDP-4-amino-4, 6-dideoxy-N-acetyl-beta-L-altrosamine transaminase n=1 Tax=Pseudoalteromonas sp. TB64 TaxID=1938600 RepID=UPI00041A7AC6|nr:UDP-4-amino-4,6-dideoxy-N-acetyl-beta-L-altrosamine transaminase [Pseudoalteromonas sp. TB64]
MIPYGKQDISPEDIAAVIEVLKSDFITQGPKVPEFEQAVAQQCINKNEGQVPFAIATNSATSALHLACLALKVGEGDVVWTSPISFVASANCALYCGSTIDFVDIDISTGNISVEELTKKLALAEITNTLPKVIIPVHLAGQSCDMQAIKALSEKYNFAIIEDASHAIGGRYQASKVGSCDYSDITIFSFHPVKIITSAEGGMALTQHLELAEQMRLLRSHGVTSNPENMSEASHGPWYYQQVALGFNYRMTELQAALGLSQVKRLEAFVTKRNQLAATYDQAFSDSSLTCLTPATSIYSAYHLYIVLLPTFEKATQKEKHKAIVTALRAKNICAHVHYIPIHLQPYYQQNANGLAFKQGDFPIAEEYYQRAISLPLYPKLSQDEQNYIIATVLDELNSLGV